VLDYGSITVIPSLSLDINEALAFHSLNHSSESWSPAVRICCDGVIAYSTCDMLRVVILSVCRCMAWT
jgi:hypothetical protein